MQNRLSQLFFLVLNIWMIIGCQNQETLRAQPEKVKNIIFLIGDGMGLAQLSTVFYFHEDSNHVSPFARFKHIGFHQNAPVGAKITDSAAGATAFSTGYKSYNDAIAVDADTVPRTTILEMAAEKGLKTGVIATSSITHATPACFYAHIENRDLEEGIASQLVESPVDYFAGGGQRYFFRRSDSTSLMAPLEEKGFQIDTAALATGTLDPGKRYGFLLADDGMPMMTQGRGDFLPAATAQALDYLSASDAGFFLMVEGSQIDWGGHANDANYILQEMIDFEKAVAEALDFADDHPGTLVLITADHETGGLSLSAAEVYGRRDYRSIKPTFSTGGHSASLIPVLAYGPGAEQFMGFYQNNDIFGKMKGLLLE